MLGIYLVIIVIGFLLVVAKFALETQHKHQHVSYDRLKFRKKTSLMTRAEQDFYKVLLEALEGQPFVVFPQMRLENIVTAEPGEYRIYKAERGLIRSRVVDYVVCTKDQFEPRLVIELDDKTHEYKSRKERDTKVDMVLEKAGMRVVHVKAEKGIDFESLKKLLTSKIPS